MSAESPRIFVSNRGEIAVRVINACRELGIGSVVGVSEIDKESLPAKLADRALCIGPSRSTESYLRADTIIAAALATNCTHIHPGYGFLAESAAFRALCDDNGLKFVGPSAEAIDAMGDKLRAREIARKLGIPLVPSQDKIDSLSDARDAAGKVGFPLLFKASAGGGGKGIRIVRESSDLEAAYLTSRAEAESSFGDSTVYIEKFVERGKHIEVQVLGDSHGNLVHLFERDCSVQRRHQKLLEEAPSTFASSEIRGNLTEAALRIAEAVYYENAGTVEFIVDVESGEFYFLEMNTRIQVEHPVTEKITGVDLVAQQIRIALGEKLSLRQSDIMSCGHAVECRINAEQPKKGFQPSPGRITTWQTPSGEGVRVDSHCYEGYLIPPHYDSMIAKLIVHADTREAASSKAIEALSTFVVEGVETTIDFCKHILLHEDFKSGRVTTRWVDETVIEQYSGGDKIIDIK